MPSRPLSGGIGLITKLFLVSLVVLLSVGLVACAELGFGVVDEEAKLLEPPSVTEILRDARDLSLDAVTVLERRETRAREDLTELYQERMDEAPSDRAVTRLENQLERAISRLENNYDERRDRLEIRLTREAEED